MPAGQSKTFCGTLYKCASVFGHEDVPTLEEWTAWCAQVGAKWAAQVEKCPSTDRLHVQFVIQFETNKKFSTVKNLLPLVHVEICRDPLRSWAYCTKPETRHGWSGKVGDPTYKGRRTDLEAAVLLVRSGGAAAVAEVAPTLYIQHSRGLQALESAYRSAELLRYRPRRCYYIWGPSRIGKSYAVTQLGDICPCMVTETTHWFEGYVAQKRLLFEEFDSTKISLSCMLQYMDNYTNVLPIKGRSAVGVYDEVYLIANIPLEEQYRHEHVDRQAAFRARFYQVHEWSGTRSHPTITVTMGTNLGYRSTDEQQTPVLTWVSADTNVEIQSPFLPPNPPVLPTPPPQLSQPPHELPTSS